MRISDLLDVIEDDTVEIEEKELTAPERIAELTLQRLHAESTEKRRHSGKIGLIVLIAAVLAALSVTAYATGLLSRLVNWQGQTVETEAEPMATVPPDAEMIGNTKREALISEILSQREGRELIIIREGEKGICGSRNVPVASVEELEELLMSEGSPFTIPVTIPEGYSLITGFVRYEALLGYEYTLATSEAREDGLVVERYTAPAEGDFISCYQLDYENASGELFSLIGMMMPESDMDFVVGSAGSVYPLTVNGMDNALGIQNESSSSLSLRRKLAAPILCESVYELMGAHGESIEYGDVTYQIFAYNMTVEDLQALLAF